MKQPQQLQISLLQESVTIPGVQLNMRGMEISPTVTDAQLLGIGSRLTAVGSFLSWAWADYLQAMRGRHITATAQHPDHAKDTPEELMTLADEHVARYCDTHHIDPKLRREYLGVATFYGSEERPYSLPYEHYRECMWMTNGDRKKARGYLCKAETEQWSLAELRRNIREGEAGVPTTAPRQSVFASYGVVHDFARFAESQLREVDDYDASRCRAILTDLEPARRLIERLTARAGTTLGR